jgi:Transposase DDE domain
VKRLPKLAMAVSAGSGHVLAVQCRIGNRSDAPDFGPLFYDAWRRAPVRTVLADSGYDSEANHRIARLDMGVRSVIPAKVGRPSEKSPSGYYRALMRKRFNRKADATTYGQRAVSESVNGAIKRNLGDNLRSIRPDRRKNELMFRALVHSLMLCSTELDD